MELKQLCEGIWYLPHDSATDRPALGYIRGEQDSLMVDCGNSPAHLALFRRELERCGLPMPETALITHWHWDHTFAMCAFDGMTVACEATARQLQVVQSWKWTDAAMKERLLTGEDIEFCDTHIRLEYPDLSAIRVVPPMQVFDREITFDLGGLTCRAIRVGGPHSEDSVLVYIPERKILFAGDGHTGDFYGLDGGYDKEKLADYIRQLQALDFETYIHGHVPPVSRTAILDELNAELARL